jgi:PKD repeat protein
MKTKAHSGLRRAKSAFAAILALGGLLTLTAQASVYQMQSNYVAGTVAPYNAGGGVPAAAYAGTPTVTASNVTLPWYGTMGWYTVQGSPDMVNWTNLGSAVPATDFRGSATVPNPFGPTASFRLSQANNYAGQGNCSGCHGDKYQPWSLTAHANAYSLVASMPTTYGCLKCHTVGYGQPTGYTDQTTTPNLANVGCEACHGPAGWHKNSDHSVILPVVSMDPAICGSCHQGNYNPTYNEYITTNSWGLFTGLSHSHTSQSSSSGCAVCHSANNRMVMLNEYNDMLAGNSHALTLVTGSDATLWTAACATCHDPHSSNNVAQLRYPTFSTNWYTMPTTFDARQVTVTNLGVISTNTVNMNTVFDSLYNPKVQVCGQCHNTRGARWDGNSYAVITNVPVYALATNLVYNDQYCTNTWSQVFTNAQGVPYLTNTYSSVYVCGRYTTTNVTSVQTNAPYGVGVTTALIPYTNGGTVYYTTNSSGYSRSPHYSGQYNILTGQVDYDYASVAVPMKTHPHSSAPDQCATCHVPSYALNAGTNVTGHTFALDYNGCLTSCHSTYTADGLTAKINNLQGIESNNMVRVTSMLNQWALTKTAGTQLTNYAQMAWEYTSPGPLGTTDAKHKSGPPAAYSSKFGAVPAGTNDNLQLQIPLDIRLARYDLYMAYNDQSMGVHNPSYVQALLDDAAARVSRQFTGANFSANTVSGFAPLTVKFTNLGTGITGYNWNFGDGVGTSASANPTYVYNTPGVYAVTFTATTASGTETLVKTNYIHVETPPIISFTADNTSVAAGSTVTFTTTSSNTGDVAYWTWYPRFGVSGAASYTVGGSTPSFSFTYTNAGTYSVELRATCQGGANGSYNRLQTTNVNYIVVH